ncbi:MAG: hypothetical protein KYX62_11900 [Pseudomonadota bacterium]|nr:hypothetical protein [Pseudomonadota bacterium]
MPAGKYSSLYGLLLLLILASQSDTASSSALNARGKSDTAEQYDQRHWSRPEPLKEAPGARPTDCNNRKNNGTVDDLMVWLNGRNVCFSHFTAALLATSDLLQNYRHNAIRSPAVAINRDGQAVIAWIAYNLNSGNGSVGNGILYARIYDGSHWLEQQIIDQNIDMTGFITQQGGISVFLDNTGQAEIIYQASRAGDTRPGLQSYSSRLIQARQ